MPVMDGYEATSEIREFYRQNQVMQPMIVACTGHVEEQFIMKAWMHEIDEILPKPVKSEILKEIIKEVVNLSDSWIMINSQKFYKSKPRSYSQLF